MDKRINLVIPATGEYRRWAEIAAQSARVRATLPIDVTILDWEEVERRGVARTKLEKLGSWHGSAITYTKMYMTELFPEFERVIVCDADVLFRGDIAQLWELGEKKLGNQVWILPSRDSQPPWLEWNSADKAWFESKRLIIKRPKDYFCAGFMMMDLKAMREGNWAKTREEFLTRYDMREMPYGEQTVMNYLLQDKMDVLPREWGCFSGDTNSEVDYEGDCAIHYVSDAPWERKGLRLMSDAVALWRQAAGIPYGGWRRWIWLLLRLVSPLWRWEPHMAWHFRTALKRQKPKVEVNGMEVVRRLLEDEGIPREGETWVHGMWLPRYWAQCIGAKLKGKTLVRMPHGSLDPVRLKYSGWKKRMVGPIERVLFRMTDRIVFTGEWEEEWFEAWMKGQEAKFEVVDLKRYFRLNARVDFNAETQSRREGPLRVMYLGRRHPLKGVEYLEEAVNELEGRVGVGDRKIELRIVSDHTGEELEKDWEWCDVLCLPTLSENFGLVVAEALERGKRVITTDGAPAWKPETLDLKGRAAGREDKLEHGSSIAIGAGGRLLYLEGYRDGSEEERIKLLQIGLAEMSR